MPEFSALSPTHLDDPSSNPDSCLLFPKSRSVDRQQETGQTRCASGSVSVSKAPVVSQLIVSIYFITSTMTQVGYGDIAPVTEIGTGILMVAMLLGASIFSYTVSNATSFIAELEGRGGRNQKYMHHVSTFLVDCGVSKPLRVQIMNFFDKRLSRSHIALPKISEV